jgi:hypothetical protein
MMVTKGKPQLVSERSGLSQKRKSPKLITLSMVIAQLLFSSPYSEFQASNFDVARGSSRYLLIPSFYCG